MLLNQDKRNSHISIVAVALFLLFDFSALVLNFWMTVEIEQEAASANLAGRQRMLSQRMVKVLLQIEDDRRNELNLTANLDELKLTFDLFDNTLKGFVSGHMTLGGVSEVLFLKPVGGESAKKIVDHAAAIWAIYRVPVKAVIDAGDSDHGLVLRSAMSSARQYNLELLDLMNGLTTELEMLTQRDARRIRIFQGVFALINLCWATWFYIWRVRGFKRRHDLFDSLVNKAAASVLALDESGIVIQANQTAETMFGYASGDLIGRRMADLVMGPEGNLVGQRKDGSTFFAELGSSEALLDERRLSITTVLDVTRYHQTEEQLSSLAYHDPLTLLPNRLLFDDRLRMEITHSQRRKLMLAVFFIDLDHFKPINDTYGHEVGDLVLQEVAARLKRCLRESDTVSRRGGDEFTVIVTDIDNHQHCERIAEMTLSELSQPFHVENLELKIGASIGISLFPNDGNDAHLLVNHADEAMYLAKQAGRGAYRFYFEGSTAHPS